MNTLARYGEANPLVVKEFIWTLIGILALAIETTFFLYLGIRHRRSRRPNITFDSEPNPNLMHRHQQFSALDDVKDELLRERDTLETFVKLKIAEEEELICHLGNARFRKDEIEIQLEVTLDKINDLHSSLIKQQDPDLATKEFKITSMDNTVLLLEEELASQIPVFIKGKHRKGCKFGISPQLGRLSAN